jgi:hypothetical protein
MSNKNVVFVLDTVAPGWNAFTILTIQYIFSSFSPIFIHNYLEGRRPEEVRKQTHRQTLDPSQAIFIIHIANLGAAKLFSYTELSPKEPSVKRSDFVRSASQSFDGFHIF